MNRRDLIKRAFVIGTAGLLLPEETIRKVWALDRTMVQRVERWENYPVIGDWPGLTPHVPIG